MPTTLSSETKGNILTLAGELTSQVKAMSNKNQWYTDTDTENNLDTDKPHVELCFRDFGHWVLPPGVEDDGDYDWNDLSYKSACTFDDLLTSTARHYTDIVASWNTGEKNCIYVILKPKS